MHTAFRFQLAKPSGDIQPSLDVHHSNITQATAKGEAKAES